LQGEVLEEQAQYWKRKLQGAPPVLELPGDRPRPALLTHQGAREAFQWPQELSEAVKALSRSQDATLFMTLLSAFLTLLYRYSGQQDISVGTPIANRSKAEVEGLIGFFVNTLVLRAELSGDLSFQSLLTQVRDTALGAYANQDAPFEYLVEVLQPQRALNRSPLFQVMFILQNAPLQAQRLEGLEVVPVASSTDTSKFDLTLGLGEGREGLIGAVEYSLDLFEASTVLRLLRHFRSLVEGIVADPDCSLACYPLLSRAERRQMVAEWNASQTEYPLDATLPQLFQDQAGQRPDSVALAWGEGQMSYRELDRRANQTAHFLRRLGTGPESAVGIFAERSLEMVVGLAGILKAGGAYLPLELSLPQERLAFMLSDASARLVLTHQHLIDKLPAAVARPVALDAGWNEISRQPQGLCAGEAGPQNLAYVIYTSGSTGKPKGVSVPHGALVRLLMNSAYARLKPGLHVSQSTNVAFDVSAFEIWGALLHGARLEMVTAGTLLAPQDYADWLGRHQIEVVNLTPALFSQFVREEPSMFASVTDLLLAGEALEPGPVRAVLEDGPPGRLLNVYGPTENSVFSTCFRLQEAPAGAASLPIGRPLSNTQAYLVDRFLQLLPAGVPGELLLGGPGLARGYLGRPELTAEKFIPDWLSGESGARLYKTGDLVKWLADGNLDFLGRLDRQVKIRGFRIELGEIEAVLSEYPAIQECAVLALPGASGMKRLVAYAASNREPAPQHAELQGFLAKKLPDYMVPSVFAIIEALPLTPNGKVDRKALLQMETGIEPVEEQQAPSTPVEELLAGIWADVLEVERVRLQDNFFDLGGHSLLATQVVSRIRSTFRVDLPLRNLFEAPTVSALSSRIEEARFSGLLAEAAPPLVRTSRQGSLPLSFAQQRLWFLDQLDPGNPVHNIPFALGLKGPLHAEALQAALNGIVRRHEALRTCFRAVEGKPVQLIREAEPFSLTAVDLRAFSAARRREELKKLLSREARRPFDLQEAPLLRAHLVHLQHEEQVLFVNMHHIASDGWSIGILVRELTALYDSRRQEAGGRRQEERGRRQESGIRNQEEGEGTGSARIPAGSA
ncbi:MAG: amino acid adenylation domain-containing protein, partial [Acidobacteriota bacterium]